MKKTYLDLSSKWLQAKKSDTKQLHQWNKYWKLKIIKKAWKERSDDFPCRKFPIFTYWKKLFLKMPKNLLAWSCWNYSEKSRFSIENNISSKISQKNRLAVQLSTSLKCLPLKAAWRGTERNAEPTNIVRGTVVSSTKCRTPPLIPVLLAAAWACGAAAVARCRQGVAHRWQCWPEAAKWGDEASADSARASRDAQCCFHLPTAKMIVSVPIGMCLSQREL